MATSSVTAGFDSLGTDLVAARINGGATTERYAFGPGVDEPMVGYDNAGALYYFHADERGSTVATSGSAGSATRTIAYDEYGKPSLFSSRFLYAGKMHFGGVNAYYNNARFYDYKLGRFLQTDPIGYGAGMNIYAYVGGDPVNFTDPSGLQEEPAPEENTIYVNGPGRPRLSGSAGLMGATRTRAILLEGPPLPGTPGVDCGEYCAEVTAPKKDCAEESGYVAFASLGGEGYLGMGGGISGGTYWGTDTNEIGLFGSGESTFFPSSGSFGWGGSLGAQVGVASDLSSFRGEYSVIGIGAGPVSINFSFARENILSPISLSIGPSANLMLFPPAPGSFHYTQGSTSLLRGAINQGSCQ